MLFTFQKSKQQKLLVPEPHAASLEVEDGRNDEVRGFSDEASSIPYVQIDTFSNFLEHVDKIEVSVGPFLESWGEGRQLIKS